MIKKEKTLPCEELKSKIDQHEDFILVDVLDGHDYHKIHIQGAMNIPLKELETKAEQWLNRQIDIIVYSASPSCKGAEFAKEILTKMGFRVWLLEGGLETWVKNQYPIEGDLNYKPHPILAKPSIPHVSTNQSVQQKSAMPQQSQKHEPQPQQQHPKKKVA